MEYTVLALARLAGVSARTLRYYDEIGLLRPCARRSSGYRVYGAAEVGRLQQIMFYRELGASLDSIRDILDAPDFDGAAALRKHRAALAAERDRLDALIANVDNTITQKEGHTTMKDKDRFEGFKKQHIEENERRYGAEIREKYGDSVVDASNRKMMNMTQSEYDEVTALAEEIHKTLADAFAQGDPAGELAQKACELHRRWLCHYWPEYSKQAHAALGQMYVDDARFTAYYDKERPGTAAFLRDALLIYTNSL